MNEEHWRYKHCLNQGIILFLDVIIVNIFYCQTFQNEYIIHRRIVKILCFHPFGLLETHTQSVKLFITSLANLYSLDLNCD